MITKQKNRQRKIKNLKKLAARLETLRVEFLGAGYMEADAAFDDLNSVIKGVNADLYIAQLDARN